MEKNSYERRAYESVDDGSPSWVTSQKMNGKQKFRQLRVKEKENFYFLLTLYCLACQIRYVWLKYEF